MTERPSPGEQLAGIAGLALLLIMFLFAWYGVDLPGVSGFDAFDSYGDWFNMIMVAAAFCGIAMALFGSGTERIPVSLSVVATVLAGIGVIVLLIYVISPPGVPGSGEAAVEIELHRKIGLWLGLIALIALTVGGYMTMQEEGISFGGAADRLSSSGHEPVGATPPPPPQGYQAPPPGQAPPPAQPPAHQPPPPPPPPPAHQPPPEGQQPPPPPPPPPPAA